LAAIAAAVLAFLGLPFPPAAPLLDYMV